MTDDTAAVMRLRSLIGGHFLLDLYSPIIPVMIPLFISSMNLSYFLAGLIITVFNLVSSVTQPFIGLYSDKNGWRPNVAYCVLLGSVGVSSAAILNNYWAVLVVVAGAALGHALFHPTAMELVHKLCPLGKLGFYNSIFTTSGSLSYALGPLIAGILIAFGGLPAIAWLVIPGILGSAWLYGADKKSAAVEREILAKQKPAKRVKLTGRFWWLHPGLVVTICSLRGWGYTGLITYLPTFLILRYENISTVAASLIVTAMLISGVFGQIIGGTLSDRFGRKKMLVFGLFAAVPPFLLIFSENDIVMYIGVMVYAFFASMCYVTSVTMTQELLPGSVGFASGLTLGFSMGIGGIGTAITGFIADYLGSLTDALFLMIIPIILAAVISIFVKAPESKKENTDNAA